MTRAEVRRCGLLIKSSSFSSFTNLKQESYIFYYMSTHNILRVFDASTKPPRSTRTKSPNYPKPAPALSSKLFVDVRHKPRKTLLRPMVHQ